MEQVPVKIPTTKATSRTAGAELLGASPDGAARTGLRAEKTRQVLTPPAPGTKWSRSTRSSGDLLGCCCHGSGPGPPSHRSWLLSSSLEAGGGCREVSLLCGLLAAPRPHSPPCLLESAASREVYVWPKGKQKFEFLPVCFPQPNSFGGASRGAPLGDAALLVALSGCPWQPFRGAGFLWAGKAPRFLCADILLSSFVVTRRSCAGRHSEQSPGPDHTPAITSGEGGPGRPGGRTRQGRRLLLRVTVLLSTCPMSSLGRHPGTVTGRPSGALV